VHQTSATLSCKSPPLSLQAYKPRAAALPKVLEPLLPTSRGLASFVTADGKVDTELCARLVARALWFLCFGEAGLLDGDELEVVAAWNSVPKARSAGPLHAPRPAAFTRPLWQRRCGQDVEPSCACQVLFMPRFLNRILFGLLARKAADARRAVLLLLRAKGLDATFAAMNKSLPAECAAPLARARALAHLSPLLLSQA